MQSRLVSRYFTKTIILVLQVYEIFLTPTQLSAKNVSILLYFISTMRRERHNDKIIGETIARLRVLRRSRGLSQMDVYLDTDINIARIESGHGNISLSTLADLCDYYRISLADFFRIAVDDSER